MMGLCATAKGLTEETEFHCGYCAYTAFIFNLIETAYGRNMRDMFEKHVLAGTAFSEREKEIWGKNCNDDLDLLIFHSDSDGKFTPSECRRIYNAINDLHMNMYGYNYGVVKPYNMLDHWKAIFKHCADRRVNLYYI